MGLLLKLLLGSSNKEKAKKTSAKPEQNKRNAKLEREMKAYGLSEEEKRLVRSGQYDPWNFEEEELEEDDYYFEDT